jgi:hypothetical protein
MSLLTGVGRWVGVCLAAGSLLSAQTPKSHSDDEERSQRLTAFLRTEQYADARTLIDTMLKAGPRADLENGRAMFGAAPNMRVRPASEAFPCDADRTALRLPLTVNGTPVDRLADTGANV